MTKLKLIGLYSSGPQMGKSTIADYLVAKHGYYRLSFAAPLRAMIADLARCAGCTQDEIAYYVYGNGKEEVVPQIGASARFLLRTLGTEWGRNLVNENIWVSCIKHSIDACWACGESVVLDDVRFPNEFRFIKALGGILVRVHRPEKAGVNAGHASDGALDGYPFDHSLLDGNLENAIKRIGEIVSGL